jgi:hypothetical protein
MTDYRLFLCGITSAGKEANLRALIEPISEYIHGLQWTFHHPTDAGYDYLFANCREGKIITAEFCQRHGYSMTHYLWQGTMEPGDFFLQVDDLERLGVPFVRDRVPGLIQLMKDTNTAMIANYGKGLLFRYNEQLEFRGSPHWYAINLDGQSINLELDQTEFWNVRGEQRGKHQFVEHYLKYYLYPAGSNHCLLGLEKHGDPQKLFPIREKRRLEFREELRKRGVPMTVEGVKQLMKNGLDSTLKEHFNQEKILNDSWRYFQLGRTDFPDDHDWSNVVHID